MIILIRGYKYDNSYNYIKLFSSKAEQNNYAGVITKTSEINEKLATKGFYD